MDPLFSNLEGPASTGRVIEAVPEDDPLAALRAREERKRAARNGDHDNLPATQDDIIDAEIVDEEVAVQEARDRAEKSKRSAERAARKAIRDAEKAPVSDLMAEAGLEPIYSTTEAAEFFDRSNQWLYWGLREGVFLDDEGVVIDPDRVGDPRTGRRRFTLTIVKQILLSSYRRGNIEPDEMQRILRRIGIAKVGGEWRESEGWHKVQVSKNKQRFMHPDKCEKVNGKWALKAGIKVEAD